MTEPAISWRCTCGWVSLAHHEFCDKCGNDRPLPPAPKPGGVLSNDPLADAPLFPESLIPAGTTLIVIDPFLRMWPEALPTFDCGGYGCGHQPCCCGPDDRADVAF